MRKGLKRRLWIIEEDNILKEKWNAATKENILQLLPYRSWDAIKLRASKLRLSRREFVGKELSKRFSRKIKVTCEVCGKELLRKPKDVRSHVFCSRYCFGVWHSKHPSRPKGFRLSNGHREKLSKARSGRFKGDKNPNWKEGITKYTNRLRKMRKFILDRDQHTCQICGVSGDNIQTHHLIPLKEASSPEEIKQLNSPENIITICRSCHNKFHPEMWLNSVRERDIYGRFKS